MARYETFYKNWGNGAITFRLLGFGLTLDWKPDPEGRPLFSRRYRRHRTLIVEIGTFALKVLHPWTPRG